MLENLNGVIHMNFLLRQKKFWGLLGLFVLAGFAWFIACGNADKSSIYIYPGPESLCGPVTNGSSKCGSISPYNVVTLDKAKSLTINASPETNFRVGSWVLDEVEIPNSRDLHQYTLNDISGNHTVTVNFEPHYVSAMLTGDLKCKEGGGPEWTCTLDYINTSNKNGFKIQFANNFIYGKDINSCVDHISISVDKGGSNTFVPEGGIAKPISAPKDKEADNTYKNQYFCKSSPDNATITLSGSVTENISDFRPIAQNFTISINDTTFKVTVNPASTIQKLKLSDAATPITKDFNGCGQYGTIVQRVFDCSLLVENYQQNDNSSSAKLRLKIGSFSKKFQTTTNDFDNAWFVVSCPPSTASPSPTQLDCAWLTPVITTDNPAVGGKELIPTGFDTNQFANSYSYTTTPSKPRLLFSGIVHEDNTPDYTILFNSLSANGYNWPDQANCKNSNLCYKYLVSNQTLFPWSQGKIPDPDPTAKSLCSMNPGTSVISIFPNSEPKNLAWQVPSYPMLILITGGDPCNGQDPGFCNNTQYAFNAVTIKGFLGTSSTTNNLWAASYAANGSVNPPPLGSIFFQNGVISFDTSSGSGNNGTQNAVRCASTQWN